MARNPNASARPKKKGKILLFLKGKGLLFLLGFLFGIICFAALYQVSVYFSTNESCMICHVHPHAEETWKLSTHVNNRTGTTVNCVDCHLPPKNQTVNHYMAKARLGIKDVWGYLTKDSADFDWDTKSLLENAVKFIPNESCKECHRNLFPAGLSDDGITSHLYYEDNEKKLNLHCISCHLDVGHYNPNYVRGQMVGVPVSSSAASGPVFEEATIVTEFVNYTEQIPGTTVTINMIAIPGGTFRMGSTDKEDFHKPDEYPVREVTVSPFFMAEVETTWNQFWAFYGQTMSEGRIPPEVIFTHNSDPDVDAISGPTPPYGAPDQGWGFGDRPAITMTHYTAEIFCQWLSQQTGKKYRLPTEAEWEYAARGGTETPYFFEGRPRDFSNQGFWRRFFAPKTDIISDYIIYAQNSRNRTQEPDMVRSNSFGLKNMLGNVLEYCADKYDPKAYASTDLKVTNPIVTEGEEWVVRGGNYSSDAADLRSATRNHTKHDEWMINDPQQPKSIWWYSDIRGIGFRVVCEPDDTIIAK
jgi:formylglycine-generating enzyme required for sulfatase activity/nitrate/TMAO reductase-like tetraheme cytochrome c subunit